MKLFYFLCVLLMVVAATALSVRADPASSQRVRLPDALWGLNAAGQLVLRYDPFRDRTFPVRRVHTVVLTDHEPKLCGDPDGTGRHTWFFTDALLIEVTPMNLPPSDPPVSGHPDP